MLTILPHCADTSHGCSIDDCATTTFLHKFQRHLVAFGYTTNIDLVNKHIGFVLEDQISITAFLCTSRHLPSMGCVKMLKPLVVPALSTAIYILVDHC